MSFLLGVGEWIYGLVSIFPKLVYFITMSLVTLLDLFQLAVRKLAGLDVYYIDGTSEQTGDIALSFIRAIFDSNSTMPAVKNAFWSLVILGVIMLVLATIVATIRSEYSGGDNNKNKVISNAVKSMFMFLIVPVSVLFGLMISDAFLIAIDRATSTAGGASTLFVGEVSDKLQSSVVNGQTTYVNYDIFGGAIPSNTQTLSGIVFQTAAFNANRVRINATIKGKEFSEHLKDGTIGNLGIFQTANSLEERAKMIDEGFAHNVVFDTSTGDVILELGAFKDQAGVGVWTASDNMKVYNLSKFNVSLVWVYYDLWMFNYVIAFAFIYVLLKIMVNIVVGLMKRLIELVALFMISPPIVAVMPLDDGKTFNKWRENFLARALSTVGVILGFNIFFLILPYIQQINFLDPTNVAFRFANMLINSVMIVVALQSIESMIAIVSKMVGADDPNKAGGALVEKVGNTVKQTAVLAAGAAGAASKVMKSTGKLAGKGISAVDKKFNNGMLTHKAGEIKDKASGALNWARSFGRNDEVKETKKQAEEEWSKTAGDKYDKKMKGDEGYQKEMQEAFENEVQTKNYGGSFEDFMQDETESASDARASASENYSKKHGTREDFINDDFKGSDKQKFIAGKVKDKHAQIYREKKAGKKTDWSKSKNVFKRGLGLTGGYVKDKLGGKNLGALYNDITGEVKGATIRGGKGGLKATQYAFLGLPKSEIGKRESQEAFDKEEKLKDSAKDELESENKK